MATESPPPDTSNENSLSSMTDRTFTCFPKMAPELRNMVWERAANLPRNLDIWAPTIGEEMTLLRRQADRPITFIPFKFCSTRPVSGILHANQESRTIALKFYKLSFGTEFNLADSLKLTTLARIYRNLEADRICPMGQFEDNAHASLWRLGQPPAWAINVYFDPSDSDLIISIAYEIWGNLLLFQDHAAHTNTDIYLYYCGKLLPGDGSYEFVDLDQDEATPEEWKSLCTARDDFIRYYDHYHDIIISEVKFVAIVVDGVRQ